MVETKGMHINVRHIPLVTMSVLLKRPLVQIVHRQGRGPGSYTSISYHCRQSKYYELTPLPIHTN